MSLLLGTGPFDVSDEQPMPPRKHLAADLSGLTATTWTALTNMYAYVHYNRKYLLRAYIVYEMTNAAHGVDFGFDDSTSTVSTTIYSLNSMVPDSATVVNSRVGVSTFDSGAGSTGGDTPSTLDGIAIVNAVVTSNADNGFLYLMYCVETSGSLTVKAPYSYIEVIPLST